MRAKVWNVDALLKISKCYKVKVLIGFIFKQTILCDSIPYSLHDIFPKNNLLERTNCQIDMDIFPNVRIAEKNNSLKRKMLFNLMRNFLLVNWLFENEGKEGLLLCGLVADVLDNSISFWVDWTTVTFCWVVYWISNSTVATCILLFSWSSSSSTYFQVEVIPL